MLPWLLEKPRVARSDVNALFWLRSLRLRFLLGLFRFSLCVGICLDATEGGEALHGSLVLPLTVCSLRPWAPRRPPLGFGLTLLQRPLHPDGAPL